MPRAWVPAAAPTTPGCCNACSCMPTCTSTPNCACSRSWRTIARSASARRHRPTRTASAGDRRLGTFNPLFPNGYYFTLAGYTGYANLLHVKPSLTVKPAANLTLMAATGATWRQTTADSVYVQPNLPIAGTAGQGRRWTGLYEQLRADWAVDRHWSAALEAVRYRAGVAVRSADGRDSNYVGVEMKAMW